MTMIGYMLVYTVEDFSLNAYTYLYHHTTVKTLGLPTSVTASCLQCTQQEWQIIALTLQYSPTQHGKSLQCNQDITYMIT